MQTWKIMNSTALPSRYFGTHRQCFAAARFTWLGYGAGRKRENCSVWKYRIIVASTCRRSVQFGCYITWLWMANCVSVMIKMLPLFNFTISSHRPLSRRLDRCDRVIQNESRDPFGGNVYYVTMQITFPTRKFRNGERNFHCDLVHITTKWVSSLAPDCNGVFAIKAYGRRAWKTSRCACALDGSRVRLVESTLFGDHVSLRFHREFSLKFNLSN